MKKGRGDAKREFRCSEFQKARGVTKAFLFTDLGLESIDEVLRDEVEGVSFARRLFHLRASGARLTQRDVHRHRAEEEHRLLQRSQRSRLGKTSPFQLLARRLLRDDASYVAELGHRGFKR